MLVSLLVLSSLWATAELIDDLIHGGPETNSASALLEAGSIVWVSNNIAFALLYWDLDGGGAAARALDRSRRIDFAFPQEINRELASPGWRPRFVDYLYLGFTNATALSPTDAMPLAPWAKLAMMLQALISLSILALVISRAVNVFSKSQRIAIGFSGEPVPPVIRSGAATSRNSQRQRALAFGAQILELQVVEQVDPHRCNREDVDREADALGGARSGVAVSVGPDRRNAPIGEEGHRRRVQARLGLGGVPGAKLPQSPGVAGPNQHRVALAHGEAVVGLCGLEIVSEDMLAGL